MPRRRLSAHKSYSPGVPTFSLDLLSSLCPLHLRVFTIPSWTSYLLLSPNPELTEPQVPWVPDPHVCVPGGDVSWVSHTQQSRNWQLLSPSTLSKTCFSLSLSCWPGTNHHPFHYLKGGGGGGRCSLEGVFLAPPHTPSCQPLDLETFFHLLPPNHQPQLSPTRRWPSLPPTLRPPSCKEGGGLACVSCLGLQADSDTAASKSPFCCLATTCDLRT